MDDRVALIAAIRAHPDDDLRHLVYADWLEETGNPAHVARAQLIRAQCEMRAMDARPNRDNAAYQRLKHCEARLLDRFAWSWGSRTDSLVYAGIDRGLTQYQLVNLTPEACAERAEDYHYALQPEACLKVFIGVRSKTDLTVLARAAFADRVTGLHLFAFHSTLAKRQRQSQRVTSQLAEGPWPGPLSVLEFRGVALTNAHIRALAASPQLRSLTQLDIHGATPGDGVADALAVALIDAPVWPNMRLLRIRDLGVSEEARQRLASRYPSGVVQFEV